ncbi:hypothetical protein F4809DRAFT_656204 [Biscogniauxia mediterranea]|nr:hypothetical protein F4809DRAFT_656204 [Biscogniauxia mediterranea]
MPGKDNPNISASYTNYLRKNAQVKCPTCGTFLAEIDDRLRNHLETDHPDIWASKKDSPTLLQDFKRGIIPIPGPSPEGRAILASNPTADSGGPPAEYTGVNHGDSGPNKSRKSPMPATPARARSASPYRRSRGKQGQHDPDPDFNRSPLQGGTLWSPDDTSSPKNIKSHKGQQEEVSGEAASVEMMKQPETRPISQEQLVAEVKGIYAGLVMVESKCIEVDNAQSSQSDAKLNNEQWQALIALHRTLLHEHHDFFLASQHPSASPALRRLASKYAMPARMWRHGIHSFLELLRHRLPGSLEHMLTFIYLAYSMMALLYETVPTFEDTWIECLGDLGRYRMAIEDDDIRDREVWTSVSRHWYSKASDKAPNTGRLYHHLAILARPNAPQQLFYYAKSLCVPIPFASARESVMTLFEPIISGNSSHTSRMTPIDVALVKAHGILFSKKAEAEFDTTVDEFLNMLDNHISRITRRWMESGYYVGIANCCALLSYGQEENVIMRAIRPQRTDETTEKSGSGDLQAQKPSKDMERALRLALGTYDVVLHRLGDPNILPFVHVILVFVYHLTRFPSAMVHVEKTFPWKLLSLLLNSLLLSYRNHERILGNAFPREKKDLPPRPLPEDFAMKGLIWVEHYFPEDWFANSKVDDDEKYFEVPSMTDERKERILWLGCRIAEAGKWLAYDQTVHQFGVISAYDDKLDGIARDADMTGVTESTSSTPRSPAFTPTSSESMTDSWTPDQDELMMDL